MHEICPIVKVCDKLNEITGSASQRRFQQFVNQSLMITYTTLFLGMLTSTKCGTYACNMEVVMGVASCWLTLLPISTFMTRTVTTQFFIKRTGYIFVLQRRTYICANAWIFFKHCVLFKTQHIQAMKIY